MNLAEATHLEGEIDHALSVGDHQQAEILVARYRRESARSPETGSPSLSFRANYLAVQVALAAGRLQQAWERFQQLLPLPGSLPSALVCRIWLLGAETLARLQRFEQARSHLGQAEASHRLASDPMLHLRALRIRLWLGQVAELEGELAACDHALQDQGDCANRALLTCEEGRAWDALGDLERAHRCWNHAEALSRSSDGHAIRADVLLQLGRLAHLRGHLQQALDSYDEALELRTVLPQVQELHLRRALVLLDLNQQGQAETELTRALNGQSIRQLVEEIRGLAGMVTALLGDPLDAEVDSELAAYQAVRRGDREKARALYLQALREASGPERRARLALALGMLALACGADEEAGRWLAQAEQQARQRELPEVHWRALLARGQQAVEQGEEEQARALLEEAVAISERQLRQLRHRTDAASHHLHRAEILRQLLRGSCRRGDASAVFRYQELDRGRLLLELWRTGKGNDRRQREQATARLEAIPGLEDLERRLQNLENMLQRPAVEITEGLWEQRQELLRQRDRLFDTFLRDRSRRDTATIPPLPDVSELERNLPAGVVYLAPAVCGEELFLLVVRRGQPAQVVRAQGSVQTLRSHINTLRRCLHNQIESYRLGWSMGQPQRAELDGILEQLGASCLGAGVRTVLAQGAPQERVVWVPDEMLHGVPLPALRWQGRYLVESHEVMFTFGGSLLAHQLRRRWPRRFLGPALIITESGKELPEAEREGDGVAETCWRSQRFHGAAATQASLRQPLGRACMAHFACHAYFDVDHPLAAHIGLPSGEKWFALDWLDEPLAGLPLVTLSACRSAQVAPLLGQEVFGLVTGLLGSGVRAVVAGLWPVADQETLPFMWLFARARLTRGLVGGFAEAQRQFARQPEGSPLFWAPFAVFGDIQVLPAPGRLWRWWARWRQARHEKRFPVSSILDTSS